MNVKSILHDNDHSKPSKYGLNKDYLRNKGIKNSGHKNQTSFEKKPSQATLKKMSMDMHDYAPVLDKTQTKFNINHQSSRTLEILDNSHPAIVGEQNLGNAISTETFEQMRNGTGGSLVEESAENPILAPEKPPEVPEEITPAPEYIPAPE